MLVRAALSLLCLLLWAGEARAARSALGFLPTRVPGRLIPRWAADLLVRLQADPHQGTAAELAAARAEAAALIEAAKAGDVFEDATRSVLPALRHRASGLICSFSPGSPINQVVVFHEPRGTSIGCNTSDGARSYSIFVDQLVPGASLEALISSPEAAIKKRFPDVTPAKQVVTASGVDRDASPLPPHKTIAFVHLGKKGPVEEREVIGYAGSWVIQHRISELVASGVSGDPMSEQWFMRNQREILENARASAGAPGRSP